MKVKIGEICKIYSGGDKPDFVLSEPTKKCCIPIYGNAIDNEGLYGYTDHAVIKSKAVTISARGSNSGASFYRDKPFVPIVRLLSLIPDEKIIDTEYLYYIIKNHPFKSTGSGQPQITIPQVSECEIEFFEDINLQKKISKVLSLLDEKIKINNKFNFVLESLAKTLYDYWFLQFEFPNEEGKPYKSSGGKMVWNEELKREIPEGWEVKDFLEVCEWEGTSQPPKSVFVYEYKDGYIRFIQNRDYSDPTSYPTYIPCETALGICDEKDILMDKYGDAGAVRFGLSGAYNVALSKIIVKDLLLREYIRSFLESKHIYSYLHNSSMASTRASLNENNVSYLKVVIPPNEILQKFNNIANLRIETKLKNDRENQQLSSLRDWLLPMLMNGQVTFKDENISS